MQKKNKSVLTFKRWVFHLFYIIGNQNTKQPPSNGKKSFFFLCFSFKSSAQMGGYRQFLTLIFEIRVPKLYLMIKESGFDLIESETD